MSSESPSWKEGEGGDPCRLLPCRHCSGGRVIQASPRFTRYYHRCRKSMKYFQDAQAWKRLNEDSRRLKGRERMYSALRRSRFLLYVSFVSFIMLFVSTCSAEYITSKSYILTYKGENFYNNVPECVMGEEEIYLEYEITLARGEQSWRYITLHTEMQQIAGETLWWIEEDLKVPETDVNKQRTIIKCEQNKRIVIKVKGKFETPSIKGPRDVISLGLTNDPAETAKAIDTVKVTVSSPIIENATKMLEEVKKFIKEMEGKEKHIWIAGFYKDYVSLAERKLNYGDPWTSEDILKILLEKEDEIGEIVEPSIWDIITKNHGIQVIFGILIIIILFLLVSNYWLRIELKRRGRM